MLFILFAGSVAIGGLYIYIRNGGELFLESPDFAIGQVPQPTALPQPQPSAMATVPSVSSNPAMEITPTITIDSIATDRPPPAPPPASKIIIDPPANIEQEAIPDRAFADLERLFESNIPEHDYYNVFKELNQEVDPGPRTYERPSFNNGDRQIFYTDQGRIEATLVHSTENAYLWMDDSLQLDEIDVRSAGDYLETNEFFGQFAHLFGRPWEPGMDNDPRFSILHVAGASDNYEIGYFSDLDEYPNTLPLFQESNQQEIIYLNMDQLLIGSDLYYGTLIHELQHLSQWNLDKNESVWLNEGLSQLAELYVGLDTAVPDAYLEKPDTRLDRWAYEEEVIDAHYANAYLFTVYLWEQLDNPGIYELVREPANGLSAVRKVLQGHDPDRSLNQFLSDWAAANYLDDPAAGQEYNYIRLELPSPSIQERISNLPYEKVFELDQLSVHYFELAPANTLSLSFVGDTTTQLIDSPPTSGEQMWFALPENDTNAQLTAAFDLSDLQQATLKFNIWFDLEEDFDFAYITISQDQGQTWQILSPSNSKQGDYGPAYTGNSSQLDNTVGGWLPEELSLNAYAGQEIMIRFQVLTDFEAVGKGVALDDIMIPELGYATDVEQEGTNWIADGFVRTGWQLPQQWSLQLIKLGDTPQVETLPLDEFNRYQGQVDLGSDGGILIVMPLTPFVEEQARYWLKIGS